MERVSYETPVHHREIVEVRAKVASVGRSSVVEDDAVAGNDGGVALVLLDRASLATAIDVTMASEIAQRDTVHVLVGYRIPYQWTVALAGLMGVAPHEGVPGLLIQEVCAHLDLRCSRPIQIWVPGHDDFIGLGAMIERELDLLLDKVSCSKTFLARSGRRRLDRRIASLSRIAERHRSVPSCLDC